MCGLSAPGQPEHNAIRLLRGVVWKVGFCFRVFAGVSEVEPQLTAWDEVR